jgi:hypothetical protein
MQTFFQQFSGLLVAPPGNLLYHLVLAFSITTAIQTAIIGRSSGHTKITTRMLTGLGMLLLGQILLFLSSGLAWQGIFDPNKVLSVLDRAIGTYSILWIIWLWGFRNPLRLADAILGIANLIWAILLVYSMVAWGNQEATMAFNASWLDWIWSGVTIVLLLAGILLLLIYRPGEWSIGIALLGLNLAGYTGHLVLTTAQGDFSSLIRLFNICSFPLLPMLVQPVKAFHRSEAISPIENILAKPTTDMNALQNSLLLAAAGSGEEICSKLTQVICETTNANICLMVYLEKSTRDLVIQCGYDLTRRQMIMGTRLPQTYVPDLVNAIQFHRMRSIRNDMDFHQDLYSLGKAIGLTKAPSLFLLPLPMASNPTGALLLLTLFTSEILMSPEEQSQLLGLTPTMVQILHPVTSDSQVNFINQAKANPPLGPLEISNTQQDNQNLEHHRIEPVDIHHTDEIQKTVHNSPLANHEETSSSKEEIQPPNFNPVIRNQDDIVEFKRLENDKELAEIFSLMNQVVHDGNASAGHQSTPEIDQTQISPKQPSPPNPDTSEYPGFLDNGTKE